MPKIKNVSVIDVARGDHSLFGSNCVLIQISDDGGFPKPMKHFDKTYQFIFMDVERDQHLSEFGIQPEQAVQIVEILKSALVEDKDVLVHCFAGICRSGAVVEVGVIMGFQDPEIFRNPNLMVKHEMMKALGLTYDSNEPEYTKFITTIDN